MTMWSTMEARIEKLKDERKMNTELIIELNKTVEILKEEMNMYKTVAHLYYGKTPNIGSDEGNCLLSIAIKEMIEMEKRNENTK